MSQLTYYTLDVFTQTPFTGNPLAVFVDVIGLSTNQMQQIAREMNLSETVFITGRLSDLAWSVRIFTPQCELPFAGHPMVGTAILLDHLGLLPPDAEQCILDVQIGQIPMKLERSTEGVKATLQRDCLTQVQTSQLTEQAISAMSGLAVTEVVNTPWIGDSGVPFHMVQLSRSEQLASVHWDLAAWHIHLEQNAVPDVCLFVPDFAQRRIHMRLFCPACGVTEDPATGSAAAALVGSLAVRDGLFGTWQISQGAELGRPSRIEAGVVQHGDGLRITIGGYAVIMQQGMLMLVG